MLKQIKKFSIYLLTAFDNRKTVSKLGFKSSGYVLFRHVGVNTQSPQVVSSELVNVYLSFSSSEAKFTVRALLKVIAIILFC